MKAEVTSLQAMVTRVLAELERYKEWHQRAPTNKCEDIEIGL